jgi:hypothetical protein
METGPVDPNAAAAADIEAGIEAATLVIGQMLFTSTLTKLMEVTGKFKEQQTEAEQRFPT